jgi:two-component system chemotaxis response regulator CheB
MTADGPPPGSVLIVDDSPAQRRFLRAAVEADGDFTVVSEARNGRDAVALVARLRPCVVLMGLDLPGREGLEAIERIMSATPTAILVCNGSLTGESGAAARAAGAVDVLPLPRPDDRGALEAYAVDLRRTMRAAARVRMITHPRGRLRTSGLSGEASRPLARSGGEACSQAVQLVALGASTGGPQALLTLLRQLPADLEAAVLVVQHMAEGFIPGLASWLDGMVPMPVGVGVDGLRLAPGTVTIAPSGGNLLLQDDRLRVVCVPPHPGQHHVPGIDACFGSIAEALGPAAIGVLLTGMGRDGAAGLLAMRTRGALTLCQDEATSTVYGMPAAAAALDAVDHQLPLPEIAPALLSALGRVTA